MHHTSTAAQAVEICDNSSDDLGPADLCRVSDFKRQPSKQLTASLPFPLQVPEVTLNFAIALLTLAEHAVVAPSDAASSKADESSPFLQEQEIKQSVAQLCS